jgi:predicted ester cyclase
MSTEEDKAVVRRLFDEAVNQRRFDVLDEVVGTDFVLHSALLGEIHGGDAYKQSVRDLLDPCPDFRATVEDLIGADGDAVVARLTYRGTDPGGFIRGRATSGMRFEFGANYIWRLANGKLVELWQEADRMTLMQQLGFAR